jgi:sigma-B regulation protein RsbU (phosphoserine phosphatase)
MTEQQKILVVDDEPLNIQVLTGLLKADYRMMVAKDGERALKIAKSGNPNLVLLDIMMPDMDGYEVCRRLKSDETTRDIPVMFITAMGEVDDETQGLELGAVDYIRKPISPPILKARVKTQLALVRQQRELQTAYAIIKSSKERMEEELNVGREIQMSMMPLDFPAASESQPFSLYARLEAAREVGGDFYDFYFLNDSLLCLCVGDVSGKGVPAALFMAVTKTLIRAYSAGDRSTAGILTHVNDVLSKDNDNCMFATLFVAVCDIGTGELTYTNASHNPPYIRKTDGRLVRLDKRHGLVAGAMQGIAYGENKLVLNGGDTLLMYTDGVTEAMNQAGELFSEGRLAELLRRQGQHGAESLIEACMSSVREFESGADQADDITLLAFTYAGTQTPDRQDVSVTKIWHHLKDTAEVNAWFDEFAQANGLDNKLSRKINLAMDDLLSNIINYAYPEAEIGQTETRLELKDGVLRITVIDDGKPFDPLSAEQPDVNASLEEREIGGLGIFLVRELMDEVSYQREGDRNVLRLSVGVASSDSS